MFLSWSCHCLSLSFCMFVYSFFLPFISLPFYVHVPWMIIATLDLDMILWTARKHERNTLKNNSSASSVGRRNPIEINQSIIVASYTLHAGCLQPIYCLYGTSIVDIYQPLWKSAIYIYIHILALRHLYTTTGTTRWYLHTRFTSYTNPSHPSHTKAWGLPFIYLYNYCQDLNMLFLRPTRPTE